MVVVAIVGRQGEEVPVEGEEVAADPTFEVYPIYLAIPRLDEDRGWASKAFHPNNNYQK